MSRSLKAHFIEPMLLLRTDALPDGARWVYELKLDGYRAIGFKAGRRVQLRSRNDNDFSVRYAHVMQGLAGLPSDTVIDGEVVALDAKGRPDFELLQNHSTTQAPLAYFVFDVMLLAGRDVRKEPSACGRKSSRRRCCRRSRIRSGTWAGSKRRCRC